MSHMIKACDCLSVRKIYRNGSSRASDASYLKDEYSDHVLGRFASPPPI